MKANKGIAMISLVIYVASFLVITTIVGTISTYFYNNMNLIDSSVGSSAEYTKLNLYIATLVKSPKFQDIKIGGEDMDGDGIFEYGVVIFYHENNVKHFLFRKNNYIYYNNTLLCSDVQSFSTKIVQKNGKDVLVVNLKLASSSFSTEYVIG